MSLRALAIANFRNLLSVEIEPAPALNIVFGANAAGKTSLLEAIHFLARVRSFRPTRIEQLIAQGEDRLWVRGAVESGGRQTMAAIERSAGHTRVRIDGEDVRSLSALAQHFPLQVINSESQRLLLDGPRVRRSFLNWTMFHVEHEYYAAWRRYDRAVRQRNAALRSRDRKLARAWEPEMVQAGVVLNEMRERLVVMLDGRLQPLLADWLPEEPLSLTYRRGWTQERDLVEVLEANRDRELEAGYCLYGPHRSDLLVRAGAVEAQHRLSRGQQKLAVIAILIAQAKVLAEYSSRMPMLLIDDLPAELDQERRQAVIGLLERIPVQSFITCVDRDSVRVEDPNAKWFHVEHGVYTEVL